MLGVLAVGATLYVGGGVGFGVKAHGAAPGIAAHPHLPQFRQLAGLVRDGAAFAYQRATGAARGGASESEATLLDADAGVGSEVKPTGISSAGADSSGDEEVVE